jgi:hypothetical protein
VRQERQLVSNSREFEIFDKTIKILRHAFERKRKKMRELIRVQRTQIRRKRFLLTQMHTRIRVQHTRIERQRSLINQMQTQIEVEKTKVDMALEYNNRLKLDIKRLELALADSRSLDKKADPEFKRESDEFRRQRPHRLTMRNALRFGKMGFFLWFTRKGLF